MVAPMFSTLASMLPSLQLNTNANGHVAGPLPFNPNNNPEEEAAEYAEAEPLEEVEDVGMKKSSGRTRNPNETFIFVRPPPAKSNHPLNLQVQLLPPANNVRRSSVDEPDTPVTLTRTASNRSDASGSGYSSTTSFVSSSSISQGRRTIIPLYSLQAHNVMTNVIVDAGTDAKIAKFQRRGLEFIDLAVLEPVEVWAEKPRTKTSRPETPDPASTSSTASLSSGSGPPQYPQYPLSGQPEQRTPAQWRPPSQIDTSAPFKKPAETTKRNIFGKMFRKNKDSTAPVSTTATTNRGPTIQVPDPEATPTPPHSIGRLQNRPSLSFNPLSPRNRSTSPGHRPNLLVPGLEEPNTSSSDLSVHGGVEEKILRPPVLGIQPTLSYSYVPSASGATTGLIQSSTLSKSARALMYVWFVKKWLKRRADCNDVGGLLGAVQQASRRTSSTAGGPTEEGVEVRFEWKRSNVKTKMRRKGNEKEREKDKDKARGRVKDQGQEERRIRNGNAVGGADPRQRIKQGDPSRRTSTISHHSASTTFTASDEGGADQPKAATPTREERLDRGPSFPPVNREREYDTADEDSDPEDSETPWVCTLKIRRTGGYYPPASGGSRPRSREPSASEGSHDGLGRDELGFLPTPTSPLSPTQVLRIKVGTLSPTPHHPKVVGMLKVPFPLPDIEVERMGINRRSPEYPHLRPYSDWPGTTLTAEEIKDVVCSTGLWLVVREGFGGVGRVSRKGDGWKIRG